jgi:hypothetical protein
LQRTCPLLGEHDFVRLSCPLFTQSGWVAVRARWKPVDEFAIETFIDVVARITNVLGKRKHAFSATSALLTVSTKSRLSLLACEHRGALA